MGKYETPDAVSALVQPHQVHKDTYIDAEIFDLEMKHLFSNTWVFVGHDSQTPKKGDYITTQIGTQPVIMVRHKDDDIKVLYNRCPHKGTKIAIDRAGNTGKFFRCPYHAWSFKTDGCLLAIPLKHTGGVASNLGAFFLTGLPGGLDYILLVLVKQGFMDRMTEKRWCANINVWLRGPSMSIYLFLGFQAWYAQTFLLHWSVLIVVVALHFYNGQYYCEQAVASYAVAAERVKVAKADAKKDDVKKQ